MWQNLIKGVGLRATQAMNKARAAKGAVKDSLITSGVGGTIGEGIYQAGGAVRRNMVPLGVGAVAGAATATPGAPDDADPNLLAAAEAVLSRGMPPAQMQEFMDATGARSPSELANALALYGQRMYDENPEQVTNAIRTNLPREQWGPKEHLALARLAASVVRTDLQREAQQQQQQMPE